MAQDNNIIKANITDLNPKDLNPKDVTISKMNNIFNKDDIHPLLRSYFHKFDIDHLKNCDCCNDIIFSIIDDEIIKEKVKQKDINYPKNNNSIPELIMQKQKKSLVKDEIYRKALIYINTNLKDMPLRICPYIYEELFRTIQIFEKDYDLRKAKVIMVVRSILNYQMSLISSNIYGNVNGMISRGVDKLGNPLDRINSNEYYKIKLNEKIIQAVKILDEMVEGNKNVNLNINANSLSIEEVFSKLHNEIKDEYDG